MQIPLPNIKAVCAFIQQEESQRNVLNGSLADVEYAAMYSKPNTDSRPPVCSHCGGKGHFSDRCWTVIGYPKWHLKHKRPNVRSASAPISPRWNTNRTQQRPATNNVSLTSPEVNSSQKIHFTSQQLEHHLKLFYSNTV